MVEHKPARSARDRTEDLILLPEVVQKLARERGPNVAEIAWDDIPEVRALDLSRVVYYTDPASPGADRFRLLRMRLRNLWATGKLRSLLITSPLPQEGKTTVAMNLATVLTEQGRKKVLLLDADLHRKSTSEHLGLSIDTGLVECLQVGLDPIQALRRVEPLGWYFLPGGQCSSENPTELLHPQQFSALLQKLTPHFDWILLDSPPVLPLTDSLSMSQAVDGTLLVARAGVTPNGAIEDAIGLLGRRQVLGLVLNGVDNDKRPYSSYHEIQY